MDSKQLSATLTELIHNLFILPEYNDWKGVLHIMSRNRWFSLIVELDKQNSPVDSVKKLGQDIYSKLVFRCIESPTYSQSGQIMVLFNLAGSSWHSIIFYQPKQDQD